MFESRRLLGHGLAMGAWATLALATSGIASGEKVTTRVFSLELPAGWKLVSKQAAPRGHRWIYASPNGGYRLRIRSIPSKGQAFEKEVERLMEQLLKRVPGFKLAAQELSTNEKGEKRFFVAGSRRFTRWGAREQVDGFMVRTLARSKAHDVFLSVELSSTTGKLNELADTADAIFKTLQLAAKK